MTDPIQRAGRTGRPALELSHGIPEYNEIVLWLRELMDREPRIPQSVIASLIPSDKSASGHVTDSTVSKWLSGQQQPPESLISAVLDARGLDPEERILCQRQIADLRVYADAARRRRPTPVPPPHTSPSAFPGSRPPRQAQLQRFQQETQQLKIAAEQAKQIRKNAEEERDGLRGLTAELTQDAQRLEKARAALTDDLRRANEQLRSLQLENIELRASQRPAVAEATAEPEIKSPDRSQGQQELTDQVAELELEKQRLLERTAQYRNEEQAAYRDHVAKKAFRQKQLIELDAQLDEARAGLIALRRQRGELEASLSALAERLATATLGEVELQPQMADAGDPVFRQLYSDAGLEGQAPELAQPANLVPTAPHSPHEQIDPYGYYDEQPQSYGYQTEPNYFETGLIDVRSFDGYDATPYASDEPYGYQQRETDYSYPPYYASYEGHRPYESTYPDYSSYGSGYTPYEPADQYSATPTPHTGDSDHGRADQQGTAADASGYTGRHRY